MAVLHQTGTQPFGSQVVTIDSVAYIASNITYDRPGSTVDHTDEIGNADGIAIVSPSSCGGSCDLMLAASTTKLPARGKTFTIVAPNSVSLSCVVESAGFTESPGAYKTARITFKDTAFTA